MNRNPTPGQGRKTNSAPRGVEFSALCAAVDDLEVVRGDVADQLVTGVSFDSRTTQPGDLYVGLAGARTHGAQFAEGAVARGAVGVLTDRDGLAQIGQIDVPVLVADVPRRAMAELAAIVNGRPADQMLMLGITGTNGKTTTAFLLEGGLLAAGRHVGTIGTIGFRLDGYGLEAQRTTVTTPESPDLQKLFATLHDRGADAIAMEISSHALALDRVAANHFDVVGFTNLGRDHLDFHETLENYFDAKALLFTPAYASKAVINIDGEPGQRMAEHARAQGLFVRTVGATDDADYQVLDWKPTDAGGAQLWVRTPREKLHFTIDLPGAYNVANAALALAMLDVAGININDAIRGIGSAQVPGRMQRVYLGDPSAPRVYVDFAHTPQAITSALSAISGRVIVVVGAGGDRDATKRPLMGEAAAQGADVVIVTDDNPRSERPVTIRRAVVSGAKRANARAVHIVDGGDRRAAIRLAMEIAEPNDAIAILGKGHETTQTIGDRVIEFDDAQVAIDEWAAMTRWSGVDQWGDR